MNQPANHLNSLLSPYPHTTPPHTHHHTPPPPPPGQDEGCCTRAHATPHHKLLPTHPPTPSCPVTLCQAKAQLAASAVPVRLVAGRNLYEEGEEADAFYMLQEGGCFAFSLAYCSLTVARHRVGSGLMLPACAPQIVPLCLGVFSIFSLDEGLSGSADCVWCSTLCTVATLLCLAEPRSAALRCR